MQHLPTDELLRVSRCWGNRKLAAKWWFHRKSRKSKVESFWPVCWESWHSWIIHDQTLYIDSSNIHTLLIHFPGTYIIYILLCFTGCFKDYVLPFCQTSLRLDPASGVPSPIVHLSRLCMVKSMSRFIDAWDGKLRTLLLVGNRGTSGQMSINPI